MPKIRPIAIYLPQFHPIPENDIWWGKGFTEWRKVVKARPRFKGHYQPHLPADLGFYDLRVPDVRQQQAEMAKSYGIHGFCYYHYWFSGKQLLERPFKEVYQSGQPDFPFMLCWANENWTRIWDGGKREILMHQEYSPEDDIRHIQTLIPYFLDKRYIRVHDRPVFVIYKDALLPDIRKTLLTFREEAYKYGLELYLCRFDRSEDTRSESPESLGFDSAIEFQPASASFKAYKESKLNILSGGMETNKYLNPRNYIRYFLGNILKDRFTEPFLGIVDHITDMSEFVEFDCSYPKPPYKIYPGVCPSWDNSARRIKSAASIFTESSPDVFKRWLLFKLQHFVPFSDDENFIFINAWNEWAEGNHLEPDEKWGYAYLEALKESLATSLLNSGEIYRELIN